MTTAHSTPAELELQFPLTCQGRPEDTFTSVCSLCFTYFVCQCRVAQAEPMTQTPLLIAHTHAGQHFETLTVGNKKGGGLPYQHHQPAFRQLLASFSLPKRHTIVS
jgi:hypothetical protein